MYLFSDRKDAGHQLAKALEKYKRERDTLVLAIPRGGVKIGYVVARELDLPLEVELIKKLGHPYNPELAIGAVSLKSRVVRWAGDVSASYIQEETGRVRKLLRQRYEQYDVEPVDLEGKTVIIIDDGVATGSTLMATIELVKESKPGKMVVAIPVGPARTIHKMKKLVDEVVCLETPRDFYAIGQFYESFEQVSDREVIQLLKSVKQVG